MIFNIGDTVFIKPLKDIEKIYPLNKVPFCLIEPMYKYCGTHQKITDIMTSIVSGCRYCIRICDFNWPETVLVKLTKKGNLI